MHILMRLWLSDQCPNSWHNTARTSSGSQPLSAFFSVVCSSGFVSVVVGRWINVLSSSDNFSGISSICFSLFLEL